MDELIKLADKASEYEAMPIPIINTLYEACRAAWFARPDDRSAVMNETVSPAMEAYWEYRKTLTAELRLASPAGSVSVPSDCVVVSRELLAKLCEGCNYSERVEEGLAMLDAADGK